MTNVQRERKRVKKGGLMERGGRRDRKKRGKGRRRGGGTGWGRRGWRISHPTRERAKKRMEGKQECPFFHTWGTHVSFNWNTSDSRNWFTVERSAVRLCVGVELYNARGRGWTGVGVDPRNSCNFVPRKGTEKGRVVENLLFYEGRKG